MKSLTEAKLKALLKEAWEHGYANGWNDGRALAFHEIESGEALAEEMTQTICNGKLIELVGKA